MSGKIIAPESTFARVYVVNLDRCPEKWRRFCDGLPADWPFPAPIRFLAVDGQSVPPAAWWGAGRGAWGIYRSFLSILERCLSEGVDSVLLLEDDALFRPTFTRDALAWLRHVPDDWGCLYLGGQHLLPPRKLDQHLFECQNVNRCHAWAVKADTMREVYQHLSQTDWPKTANGKPSHVDHQLGRFHMAHWTAGDRKVLCPPHWLVGQAAGRSNIAGKEIPSDRFWKDAARFRATKEKPAKLVSGVDRPVIVVLGCFRGGTSCTAGLLHQLGVSMGKSWASIKGNPRGTYEARRLAQFCRRAYKEPHMTALTDHAARVAGLRRWAAHRCQDIAAPAPIGAKHPALCLMVSEILEAWPAARFVAVDRPISESVASLRKLKHWGWPETIIEPVLRRMLATRDAALAAVAPERICRLDYAAIVGDPSAAAQRLAEFAGIDPSPAVMAAAAASVDPQLWTERS